MTRVLVVDDAAFMRKTLRLMLEKHKCEVVGEAEDGIKALEQISILKPDLVTLDITMPRMNGLECLLKIQELNDIPQVIVISALGQESTVAEAMSNGAKGFIVKPFKEELVVSMLESLLGQENQNSCRPAN